MEEKRGYKKKKEEKQKETEKEKKPNQDFSAFKKKLPAPCGTMKEIANHM